jgi:hypothetical protein
MISISSKPLHSFKINISLADSPAKVSSSPTPTQLLPSLINSCTSGTCKLISLVPNNLGNMLRWIALFFGLDPIKPSPSLNSGNLGNQTESSIKKKDWPEGPQVRKEIRFFESNGWVHSNWSWRSNGYIDHPGSLHPKVDKAECCHCLEVLICQTCEKTVWPSTKTADMNAQLARHCPECTDELRWITCNARTYHFVIEEGGSQYSVWKHTGFHAHLRPPTGRRPPRSIPGPPVTRTREAPLATHQNASRGQRCARTASRAQKVNPVDTERSSKKAKTTTAAQKWESPAATGSGYVSGGVVWKDESRCSISHRHGTHSPELSIGRYALF